MRAHDIAVVGGGFFGARLALLLAGRGLDVLLLEREARILARASWRNQARVHNGYHYPRSRSTANGSHRHYERFLEEMAGCVVDGFDHLYAIARQGSFTTADQFERFCQGLGLPLRPPPAAARRLFDPDRVEAVYLVREAAFDARAVRASLEAALAAAPGVTVAVGTEVARVELGTEPARLLTSRGQIRACAVLIVAYAGINTLLRASGIEPLDLKAEITEVCLIDPPRELAHRGVTVMDGPFFSAMPMPAEGCHSLTHVRYTPHASWDLRHELKLNPYAVLDIYSGGSRFPHMQRDAARYVPALRQARSRGALLEVKAVPNRHELDDGRPIVVRRHSAAPACISVLGAKLDSVFELEEAIVGLLGL